MVNRFIRVFKTLNLRKNEFAAELGLTPAAVSDIMHGRVKKISGSVVELLKVKYKVNPAWLNTGEGEMFLQGIKADKVSGLRTDSSNNDFEVIEGDVETYPNITMVEQISRTGWFGSLSGDKKFIVAGLDEIQDTEFLRDLKGMISLKVQTDRMKKNVEESQPLRQKGEAG